MPTKIGPSSFDRFLLRVAPGWALSRARARTLALRHYEAAQVGRRTSNWPRSTADANAANGPALTTLRSLARDLTRNNPWARRGLQVIANNTVGWGIVPKPVGPGAAKAAELWKRWGETTDCDADGRLTFYGIQRQALQTIAESGEVLIRRRWRRLEDGLAVPLQLQLLEPDFIDTTQDNRRGVAGGPIIHGVEHDALGRRVAYWLFEKHPGGAMAAGSSKRYPAEDILHGYRQERPGQVRGVSWFAPVLVRMRDFDEFEDAKLMGAKIAACFAGFVEDVDGEGAALGVASTDSSGAPVETIEPGMISYMRPGQKVTFANPPGMNDDGFSGRTLRAIGAGLGVTYEDLTGDYSQVNFSSARMARLAHWANVHDWRWNCLIPQLCDPAWAWAMEAAAFAGELGEAPAVEWTSPPMPMIEPDKEGLAISRMVRSGVKTFSEMVREQGGDPAAHFDEYAADLKLLDKLGIKLDSDVRAVSQAGLTQERAGAGGGSSSPPSTGADTSGGESEDMPEEMPAKMDGDAAAE